ncbi:MAG: hypothetical protein C5B59_07085 [Bacteroidetes bacterium]|nr:MAG: hypothetical protein C5B59_07085 [Bacteroidota bacterium]
MDKITYQQIGNSYIDVHVGKKRTGKIVPLLNGNFRYEIANNAGAGEEFGSIKAVKLSLEGQ